MDEIRLRGDWPEHPVSGSPRMIDSDLADSDLGTREEVCAPDRKEERKKRIARGKKKETERRREIEPAKRVCYPCSVRRD